MTSGELASLVVGISTGTLPAVAAFILSLRKGWKIDATAAQADATEAKVKTHGAEIVDLKDKADRHDSDIATLQTHTKCPPAAHRPKRQSHHNSHLNGG